MIEHRKRRTFRLLLGGVLAGFCWGAGVPLHAAATPNPAEPSPLLQAQIWLDRLGISPGEIDGVAGENSTKAVAEFQRRVRRRVADGKLDWLTRRQLRRLAHAPALVVHKITEEEAAGPFVAIPSEPAEQAKLERMGYSSLKEALGERFHASPELLEALNPGAKFVAGESLRVPNVLPPPPPPVAAATPATPGAQPPAQPSPSTPATQLAIAKVVVSKSARNMKGLDAKGTTVFYAPASSGSEHDPLPLGSWKVVSVSRNPIFHYNPDLFWDAEPTQEEAKLPAGPNNPVGVGWVGLSKEHYGLHGSPSPGAIGHTESHGCVRLTNWDALRLMAGVAVGTPVEFVE
ncbi:MAG TPA: L,D-transpeptidase family protein [Thermoanaerobaculia bacterium]|jgi:lipoprotein-anchoring transpeptidase ErfK/SrfK|nr:L,D-transpeptidase family protein [Thermoanaerobaculia bacterium]